MDPALQEYIKLEVSGSELEAIVKLADAAIVPPGVKVVSRFGDIATCRLSVANIPEVWASEAVLSLKAPRYVSSEPLSTSKENASDSEFRPTRAHKQDYTGRGVAVGIVDWGFDFTHPNFIKPDTGETRFLAIWDQTAPLHPSAKKYGYGHIYSHAEINSALRTDRPFDTLGYRPGKADIDGQGTHGTHVTDIAAGNGSIGEAGMAPQAYLIGVHLSAGNVDGLANLGDSVRILEAIDFIEKVAGKMPLVINLSVGKHGGSHQGNSLVEQGFDNFVLAKSGRAIVNSAGNYYGADTHASGRVLPGGQVGLRWEVDENDHTPNELEVWYAGRDILSCTLRGPKGTTQICIVGLGKKNDIIYQGKVVGRVYHRAKEPNTGNNHINIFLYRQAPKGQWELTLEGMDVVDGRYHAWIERDSGCSHCQSRFHPDDVDRNYTTGSICNGFYTITTGAYDYYSPDWRTAPFSSAGPTADGRQKPNLLAPGVRIRAARSVGTKDTRSAGLLTDKSGTSMAAPHVTGAIALLFEAAEQPLTIDQTRNALLTSLRQAPLSSIVEGDYQRGIGILDIENLLNPYVKNRVKTHFPESETNSTMEATYSSTEQATTQNDFRLVISSNAMLRQGRPNFVSTGRKLERYIIVKVIGTEVQNGKTYVEVEIPPLAGATGPSQHMGWTLATNLESNDAATINWMTVKSELVRISNREYTAWNVPNATFETNSHNFPEQQAYWSVVGIRPTDTQLGSNSWQRGHAWSAAFISYVVQQAGAGTHFCYNGYHSCYIVCARHNREYGHRHNPFWAYPVNDPISAWPEPGDILCKNRDGGTLTLASIRCGETSHCDIIVEVDRERRRITTIGGNVDNRVARRIVRLDAQGFIDTTQLWEIENAGSRQPSPSKRSQEQYFAIIKVRTNLAIIPSTANIRALAAEDEEDFMGVEAVEIDDFAGSWPEQQENVSIPISITAHKNTPDENYNRYDTPDENHEIVTEENDSEYDYNEEDDSEDYADCGCKYRETLTIEPNVIETHYGQHEACQECGEYWLEQAREHFADPLHALNPRSQEAAQVFDAVAYDKKDSVASRWLEQYTSLYSPRAYLGNPLLPGDILVERNFGSGQGEMAVLTNGELLPYTEVQNRGLNGFSSRPGYYVEVLQGERHGVRHIADEQGYLLANQVVMRARLVPEMSDTAACRSFTCWAQESLNMLLSTNLTVNGRISQDMRTLIQQFQYRMSITGTGTIDPITERALLEARARHTSPANATALRLDTTDGVLREASRRIIDYTAQVPLTACMNRVDDEDRKRYYNYQQRRADQRDPRLIKALVLHHMAFLRTNQTAEAHKCTNSHFIILQDGSIYQLHPVSAHLYASHGWNPRSVAVEFAGNFRNTSGSGPHIPTQAQYEAGRFLVKYLIHLLGIDKVLTHSQSSTKSGDPGPDIWYHVGEWSMRNLGITDTTQEHIGQGRAISSAWREWDSRGSMSITEDTFFPEIDRLLDKSLIGLSTLLAIIAGERNVPKLTDMVYYFKHPERNGQRIEPGDKEAEREWTDIKQSIIDPLIKALSASSTTSQVQYSQITLPSIITNLGKNTTPPSSMQAYRKFRLTTYHITDQSDFPIKDVEVPVYDQNGSVIAEVSPAFFADMSLEGSGRLKNGQILNVSGKWIEISSMAYDHVWKHHQRIYPIGNKHHLQTSYSGLSIKNGRVHKVMTFHIIKKDNLGIGYGVLRKIPLVPFRTLAADLGLKAKSDPNWKDKGGLVPAGTHVFIKEYVGIKLPDGTTHDGWFIVNDTGGGIFGAHFDIFTGTSALRKQVKLPNIGHVWFEGIEAKIPADYNYGR